MGSVGGQAGFSGPMRGSTLRPPHCCAGIHSTWLPAPSWQPQPAPSLALRRAFFPSHTPGMPLLLKQNLLILDRQTRYQLFDGLWEAHALRPPFTTSPPNCILSPCCTSLQTLPKILARLIDAPVFFAVGDGKKFLPFLGNDSRFSALFHRNSGYLHV